MLTGAVEEAHQMTEQVKSSETAYSIIRPRIQKLPSASTRRAMKELHSLLLPFLLTVLPFLLPLLYLFLVRNQNPVDRIYQLAQLRHLRRSTDWPPAWWSVPTDTRVVAFRLFTLELLIIAATPGWYITL